MAFSLSPVCMLSKTGERLNSMIFGVSLKDDVLAGLALASEIPLSRLKPYLKGLHFINQSAAGLAIHPSSSLTAEGQPVACVAQCAGERRPSLRQGRLMASADAH